MAVEGGTKIIKYLVLFFNLIFFILGIVLIGIGGWAEYKYGSYLELSSIDYASGSRLLIAIGCIIAVVAFCGCCGAWKESKCLLIVFFSLLLAILVLEITSAALAYVHRDKVKASLQNDMKKTISERYGTDKGSTDLVDLVQKLEKCCGAVSFRDWVSNKKFNATSVPDSCCKKITDNCGKNADLTSETTAEQTIYVDGCYDKVAQLINAKLKVIAGMAVAILVIQLLGMMFALCLICRVGKEVA